MLYCLGNNDKKKTCMCSVKTQMFSPNIVDPPLVEFAGANKRPTIL
jgi:hypothetical protein